MTKRKKKQAVKKPKASLPEKATNWWLWPSILTLFAFFLYANTIGHDYVLDDDIITRQNKFVQQGFGGLKDIFTHGYLYGFNGANDQSYRPLVLANMAIEHQFFGNSPRVSHFFNVLFFAIGIGVLLMWLRQLFTGKKRRLKQWLPVLIAALFAAHPIHTEVVANIKSRDEILSFVFAMICLYSLVRSWRRGESNWFWVSVSAYLLCVLSKETGLAVLGLVPLTLYFFSEKSWVEIGKTTAPYLGVAAFYFLVRFMVMDQVTFGEGLNDPINNSLLAANGASEWLGSRLLILGYYIKLLLWPHPLSFDYSYPQIPIVGMSNVWALLSLLVYLGLGVIAVWGWKRKTMWSYGILFYLIMLALVANILTPIGAPMAERFVFMSSLGFCIALAYTIYWMVERWGKPTNQQQLLFGIIGIVVLLYSGKTLTRNAVWENAETLYSSGLITAPNSARAHNHYGTHLRMAGEQTQDLNRKRDYFQRAIKSYQNALKLYPEYSEAAYNLGVTHYQLGDKEGARKAYQNLLQQHPNYIDGLNNLGIIYFQEKNYPKAMEYWQRILETQPDNPTANGNLGAAYFNQERYPEAIQFFEKAVAVNPTYRDGYANLVKAYQRIGDAAKANAAQQKLNELGG